MFEFVLQRVRIYLVSLLDALLGRAVQYALEREELIKVVDGIEDVILEIANGKGVQTRSIKRYKIVSE